MLQIDEIIFKYMVDIWKKFVIDDIFINKIFLSLV